MKWNWSDDVIVRPKKLKKLPPVLSRDEILAILDNIDNIKHKTVLITAYSSGLRISEVQNLRLEDIDSKSKTISLWLKVLLTEVFTMPEIQEVLNTVSSLYEACGFEYTTYAK